MFLMFKPLYLRFAALCAEQILCFMRRTSISFCRRTRKNASFWQVSFYLSTQKKPSTIRHKAILSRVHKFFARFHLDFSLGFIKPTFNAGIRQRLLRRKIGSGSALRLGSGFRLRLRIRNSQQIVSLSECGRGSYSLRQRFCYSRLFLPQKILFVNDLRQLNAYFYFCLHIRRKKAVKQPQNRHIFGIFR